MLDVTRDKKRKNAWRNVVSDFWNWANIWTERTTRRINDRTVLKRIESSLGEVGHSLSLFNTFQRKRSTEATHIPTHTQKDFPCSHTRSKQRVFKWPRDVWVTASAQLAGVFFFFLFSYQISLVKVFFEDPPTYFVSCDSPGESHLSDCSEWMTVTREGMFVDRRASWEHFLHCLRNIE